MPRKPREKYKPPASSRSTVRRSVHAPLRQRETGNGRDDGQIWLSRIAKTMRLREEMLNGAKDWRLYYRWFEEVMWQERGMEGRQLASDNARNTATVNTAGSIALSYMPFLVNSDIKFKLKPRKIGDVVSAQIQQGLLNYEWRERGMTEQIKAIVQDICIIGHGIGKTGYVVEVDEARKPKQSGEIEYREYIRRDAAFIERVNPLDFLFDLSAKDGSLKTARWVAERFFAPYDDVMDNSAYDKEVIEMVHAGTFELDRRPGYEGMGAMDAKWGQTLTTNVPEDHLVAMWEIWDKKFKKRYVYAENVPWPLVEEAWPYDYLDGFPYTKIDYIPVPNRPYGKGIYRQVEDQQMQLNRIRTAQFLHIRSHSRKFISLQGSMHPDELTKFTDGGDGTVVVAERPDAIQPIPDAPMSQDFQVVEARIAADMQQITGADALLQGQRLPSRTTAGEVSTRANILRLKAEDRVAGVERGVIDLATQVLQHLKANRTIPDVVEVTGAQGLFWREYSPEEIQAGVDVEVEYFAAPKFDPELDRQQRLQILQLGVQALPALQQAGAAEQLDIVQLFAWVLEGFDKPDIGRFFKPALRPVGPLIEIAPENTGTGLPPALAGQLAPAQLPRQAAVPAPGEGLSLQDLTQALRGQTGTPGAVPGV